MEPSDNFLISESGWLLNESGRAIAKPDQFCLEQFNEFKYQTIPIVCAPLYDEPNMDAGTNIMHIIGMLLSLPFLFLTFLVYALIKDLQNLHGKSLMCHVATLLMAYTSLIAIQFVTDKFDNDFCIILGKSIFLYMYRSYACQFYLGKEN